MLVIWMDWIGTEILYLVDCMDEDAFYRYLKGLDGKCYPQSSCGGSPDAGAGAGGLTV